MSCLVLFFLSYFDVVLYFFCCSISVFNYGFSMHCTCFLALSMSVLLTHVSLLSLATFCLVLSFPCIVFVYFSVLSCFCLISLSSLPLPCSVVFVLYLCMSCMYMFGLPLYCHCHSFVSVCRCFSVLFCHASCNFLGFVLVFILYCFIFSFSLFFSFIFCFFLIQDMSLSMPFSCS